MKIRYEKPERRPNTRLENRTESLLYGIIPDQGSIDISEMYHKGIDYINKNMEDFINDTPMSYDKILRTMEGLKKRGWVKECVVLE